MPKIWDKVKYNNKEWIVKGTFENIITYYIIENNGETANVSLKLLKWNGNKFNTKKQ